MAAHFTKKEWQKINSLFDKSAGKFGLPERRNGSVVIGTFNIRKLGNCGNRTAESWGFLKKTVDRFDLLAVQEIMDDLSGFEHIKSKLGNDYGMVVSDITGATPGEQGNAERLGFLFNWKKVERTALASDITFDRSDIARNLYYEYREEFCMSLTRHSYALKKWKKRCKEWAELSKENKDSDKKPPNKPRKPSIKFPGFLSFIRQPHCVSFRIRGETADKKPYEFLAVNAHLLYGKNKEEREWEFFALLEWLSIRAKYIEKLYHPNILLLGDCNLDFDDKPGNMRKDIDERLKKLNKEVLKSKKAATANFPLLTKHCKHGILRTALRQGQTYDQIGIFSNDPRLPKPGDNANAGTTKDGYDYGVFNIANLISNALHRKNIDQITDNQKKTIFKKAEFDISDHMPAWIRLKLP